MPGRVGRGPIRWLAPAAALAGAALIAILLLRAPAPVTIDTIPIAQDMSDEQSVDFELLLGDDELEMIEELEFFAWLTEAELERAG